MPQLAWRAHPSEEALEEYAFNRLSEKESAPLEEHLLLCQVCQERLAETDEYIGLMKLAARELQAAPMAGRRRGLLERGFVWAGAAAAACAVGILLFVPHVPAENPQRVELLAFRGGEEISHATAGHRVSVAIDVSDLSPSAAYRLEVVDATGREEWRGKGVASGGTLSLEISRSLSRGVHWVRLSSARGELLREFGLRID